MELKNIKDLFKDEKQIYFDFSEAPTLVRSKDSADLATKVFDADDASRWDTAQNTFLRWTADKRIFTEEFVQQNYARDDLLFRSRGFLEGKVLDIGGGWGLYRQWWEPDETEIFIVHDPGVDRFLHGPHELHHKFYSRAFSLPMTFVEGFGEDLPYQNEMFDTYLIASALDHCVDPQQVMNEAYRCLKPGGHILIIQHCETSSSQQGRGRSHLIKRFIRHLKHPRHLLTIVYERLFYRSAHLHHFVPADILSLIEQAGFSQARANEITGVRGVYVFEAER